MKNKGLYIGIGIAIIIGGFAIWYFTRQKPTTKTETPNENPSTEKTDITTTATEKEAIEAAKNIPFPTIKKTAEQIKKEEAEKKMLEILAAMNRFSNFKETQDII
jgi:hypothetical protein